MAGFNRKFKVSNNYISACRRKLVRVYEFGDGLRYTYIDNKKICVEEDIKDGKLVYAEYHHSKNK
jgi:hypothetical protein